MTQLVTVREAAKLLRIGVRTVWKWDSLGILPPAFRFGPSRRTVRWDREQLEAFLTARQESRPR